MTDLSVPILLLGGSVSLGWFLPAIFSATRR